MQADASTHQRSSSPKRWVLLAQVVVLVLVAWGMYRAVIRGQADLAGQDFHISSLRWRWLVVASAFYAVGASMMGVYWYLLLHRLGQKPRFYETLRAFFIGHLGKYVPGKFLVVLMRTGLIRSDRVDTTIAAASVFVDTLTMMAAGAFLSGVILLIWFRDQVLLQGVAFGLMVLTAALTLPPILKVIIRKLKSKETADRMANILEQLNWSTLAIGWGCAIVSWCFSGLSLWATIQAIPILDATNGAADIAASGFLVSVIELARLVASVALATVSGFVSLLPGGLGVREWVLNELMTPTYGAAVSIIAAVLLRLTWLLTELVVSTILYVCAPRPQKHDL